MRILVTGSRNWEDRDAVTFGLIQTINRYARERYQSVSPDVTVVHGDCPRGADRIADEIARGYGWTVERHPADWDTYGKPAGFRRNADMVNLGADYCVAFIRDDSKGATMTADLAERAGIPTIRYRHEPDPGPMPF